MDSAIRDKLFALVRLGMGLNTPLPNVTSEECTEFLKIAKRQSILPIVYQGLKNCHVSDDYLKEADMSRTKAVFQVLQQEEAMKRVGDALELAGIPYIPLKGLILRKLYPRSDLRTSSDIDVLVREEDLENAVKVVEDKAGFRTVKHDYHDVSMVDSHVHLELHFSIKENRENIDSILIKAWDFATPERDGCCHKFTPEFLIFHVVAHMSHHFLNGGLGIRPFIDLWLLKKKMRFDEKCVEELFSKCGLLKFYLESCYLSEVWLENKEHSDVSRKLESFCLLGGVFGNEQFRIAGAQRRKRGLRYVCSRVFPSKYQVKEFYMAPDGKKHSLPYYHIKRWKSWMNPKKRKDLKYQLNAVLKSDKDFQKAADDLFDELGL